MTGNTSVIYLKNMQLSSYPSWGLDCPSDGFWASVQSVRDGYSSLHSKLWGWQEVTRKNWQSDSMTWQVEANPTETQTGPRTQAHSHSLGVSLDDPLSEATQD